MTLFAQLKKHYMLIEYLASEHVYKVSLVCNEYETTDTDRLPVITVVRHCKFSQLLSETEDFQYHLGGQSKILSEYGPRNVIQSGEIMHSSQSLEVGKTWPAVSKQHRLNSTWLLHISQNGF